MLTSFASCVLVWTTGGCMRSSTLATRWFIAIVHSILTFARSTHSRVADISPLIPAWSLDERGLFVTKGDIPQAYSLMFNEFLIDWINVNGLKSG
jgi:hypothetical protein